MNLFSTKTKTIKTYGKKNAERVVNINTWNYEVEEKLGETVNLSGSNPIHDTAKKNSLKRSTTSKQTTKDVTSKNAEKKPTRKTFTKGFTKSKHYVSPLQPSQKSTHAKETTCNMENISPKLPISSKTLVREKTPSPVKSHRMPLTPKKPKNKYHSQTEDHDHLPSSPFKILYNKKDEKENVFDDRHERTSSFTDIKHLEIDKLIKGREQISVELTELLKICDQKQLWTFEEFLGIDCLNNAAKIGEASFSEVYSAYAPEFTTTRVKCVFKVIPFGRGKEVLVNGEEQGSIRDITQEIKTTLELGGRTGLDPELRVGFLKLYGVGVCCGNYPKVLLKEWDRWNKEYKSENDRPDYFDDKQLYAVLIVEYGGVDLEHVKLKNWMQAWSVLTQVGWSTAQAEQSLKFEHRDLHWGNITIKPTKSKSVSYNLLLANVNVEVETFGVRACIIDYTLSRMERGLLTTEYLSIYIIVFGPLFTVNIILGDEVIYVDILDEGYFTGKGDYQFDIYRMMREESKGDWKSFWPKTNVFWLHYIADKLLTAKKLSRPKKDSDQYDYYNAIVGFKKRALAKNGGYKSAMEAMNQDEAWRI
ncbi:hypothetical protein C1646_753180 [Rhizophagus diaphanus]|nr:hypothetical protein C1646_753180 [Rhizophagus diaphanus] [Rhizophagus sp. MUCL 43196]